MTITLKQFHDKCKELSDQGYEVWISGKGDGTFKLNIEGIIVGGKNEQRKYN